MPIAAGYRRRGGVKAGPEGLLMIKTIVTDTVNETSKLHELD